MHRRAGEGEQVVVGCARESAGESAGLHRNVLRHTLRFSRVSNGNPPVIICTWSGSK